MLISRFFPFSDHPDIGEALALVPDGHQAVAVFPPFSYPRSVPAIAVIFSETSKLRRRKLRRYKRQASVGSMIWNFFANFETSLLCMKPRMQRLFFARDGRSSMEEEDGDELNSTDDCFKDELEPTYGFRVKLKLKDNEPCKLKNCLQHLNLASFAKARSSNVEYEADSSPECKIKNICG